MVMRRYFLLLSLILAGCSGYAMEQPNDGCYCVHVEFNSEWAPGTVEENYVSVVRINEIHAWYVFMPKGVTSYSEEEPSILWGVLSPQESGEFNLETLKIRYEDQASLHIKQLLAAAAVWNQIRYGAPVNEVVVTANEKMAALLTKYVQGEPANESGSKLKFSVEKEYKQRKIYNQEMAKVHENKV